MPSHYYTRSSLLKSAPYNPVRSEGAWTAEEKRAALQRDRKLCCDGCATLIFNSFLWEWKSGMQRERELYYIEMASCVVMGGRHSCLTTPYGIGSLDCRGPSATEYPKWDWEPGLQRERKMYYNEIASRTLSLLV